MLRFSVLLVTLAVNVPVLYQALWTQTIPVDNLLIRLLITLPIVALLLGGARTAFEQRPDARARRGERANSAPKTDGG